MKRTKPDADFGFSVDAFFCRLVPNTDPAAANWRLIAAVYEGGVIPLSAWPSIRAQLRAAGYSVRSWAPASAAYGASDDALLAALSTN